MTDPNGWPDPSRPGVPMNPEQDGWHWLHHPEDLRRFVQPWNAELGGWPSGALYSPQGVVELGFCYLGPCLTPAEVAALVAEARAKALEEAATVADALSHPDTTDRDDVDFRTAAIVAAAIRALKEKT